MFPCHWNRWQYPLPRIGEEYSIRGLQPMRERDFQRGHPRVVGVGATAGFLLIDSYHNPLYINAEAVRILTYPDGHPNMPSVEKALAERIRSVFHIQGSISESGRVLAIKSGRRRYLCRFFPVSSASRERQRSTTGLLIERSSGFVDLLQMAEDFHLTERERESVQLLAQGLTSKEIANRMGISPNTVKAFLRLVMIKTGVTNRSGIIAKLIQNTQPGRV